MPFLAIENAGLGPSNPFQSGYPTSVAQGTGPLGINRKPDSPAAPDRRPREKDTDVSRRAIALDVLRAAHQAFIQAGSSVQITPGSEGRRARRRAATRPGRALHRTVHGLGRNRQLAPPLPPGV